MKVRNQIIVFLVLFFFTLLLNDPVFGNVQAIRGIVDLRETSFKKSNIYSLNGDWEFYWNQLFEPDTFLSLTPPKPDLYGKVPSYWTEYLLNGQSLPGSGFCTYRLLILLPPGFQDELAFDVPVFDSSFKLYINGESVGGNGSVGKSSGSSMAGYKPFLLSMNPRTNSIEIIIQASNFQHRRGGFWKQMKIGLADHLIQEHQRYVFTSYLSMGILLAFSLFFFFFFLFYRKDLKLLVFAIFLAGVFIRLICAGIYPITLLFDISWDWIVRLEYLGMYIAAVGFIWFMHFLYPMKLMNPVNIINTSILLIFCLFIPFTKVNIFAYTMLYFQYAIILYLLFYLVYSFITIFSKAPYNAVYFGGFVILFFALINDIGLANSKSALTTNYTNHIAVQIFIFIHAVMLIRSWIRSFIEKEKLNKEIEYLNTNLEKIILERTKELQNASRELGFQNEKIAIQNKQLKDEITFKNRVFSIIAHDLKSPISSLLQYFEVVKNGIVQDVRDAALNSIHNLVISANDLIENLLYWGRSQGNHILGKNQEIDLDEIVKNVIAQYKETAERKSIDLSYSKIGMGIAYCDPELIQIVLRNLVSNAIKFTNENGFVSLQISPDNNDKSLMQISITDNGVGLSEDKLKLLSVEQKLESSFGTSREKGTGLGLNICFELLKLIDGKMEFQSQVGQGTKVIILLPASKPG